MRDAAQVSVLISSVDLSGKAGLRSIKEVDRRDGGASVVVVIDMLAAEESRSPRVSLGANGKSKLDFKHTFGVGRGSGLHEAVMAAFESEDKTDSEVQLAVLLLSVLLHLVHLVQPVRQ